MPSESAFARISENDARRAKARHSSRVRSNTLALLDPEFEDLGDRLAVGLEARFVLPDLGVPGVDRVEQAVDRGPDPASRAIRAFRSMSAMSPTCSSQAAARRDSSSGTANRR